MNLIAAILIYLWIAGFVASFVIQTVFREWFAANTHWGVNKGWQNEIAIWNMGIIAVISGILFVNSTYAVYMLPGLLILSVSFAVNHFIALKRSRSFKAGNFAGMLANILISVTIIVLITGNIILK